MLFPNTSMMLPRVLPSLACQRSSSSLSIGASIPMTLMAAGSERQAGHAALHLLELADVDGDVEAPVFEQRRGPRGPMPASTVPPPSRITCDPASGTARIAANGDVSSSVVRGAMTEPSGRAVTADFRCSTRQRHGHHLEATRCHQPAQLTNALAFVRPPRPAYRVVPTCSTSPPSSAPGLDPRQFQSEGANRLLAAGELGAAGRPGPRQHGQPVAHHQGVLHERGIRKRVRVLDLTDLPARVGDSAHVRRAVSRRARHRPAFARRT